ncbi:MAG TPA: hypothetical protein DDW14_05505 [Spirochaetaceae bacterium]|nr:hypothetical protein [Spirochaetaceae bacterium]
MIFGGQMRLSSATESACTGSERTTQKLFCSTLSHKEKLAHFLQSQRTGRRKARHIFICLPYLR